MLFLIILVLTLIGSLFLPWWAAAIIAFVAAFICGNKAHRFFWSGFAGVSVAWVILALLKSIPNKNVLATRVAHLFQLPNWVSILVVTGVVGGLIGGMGALSGALVRKAFKK